jgi:hypothetical protein
MGEKPILFSGPMVRAILAGNKTQTRRVVKLIDFGKSTTNGYDWHFRNQRLLWNDVSDERLLERYAPYKKGQIIWVRETCRAEELGPDLVDGVRYRADDMFATICNLNEAIVPWLKLRDYNNGRGTWVPSIYMPRWASRISLEVLDVNVERLQEITEEDAMAEGVESLKIVGSDGPEISARSEFALLWDSINGKKYPWDSNPWVWKITFRKVEK